MIRCVCVCVCHGVVSATARSAASSSGGRERPRRVARRRIPAAAFCESEYLSDAFGSRIAVSDGAHEHSASPLGHTEVLRIKSSPRDQIPALGQRVEDDSEIPAAVAGVEPFDVFQENCSGAKSVCDSHGFPEEPASLSCKPCSLAGDAEVLAGETSAEEVNVPVLLTLCDVPDVLVDGDVREPGGEDGSGVGVNLGEEEVPESRPGKSDIHASDA
jgi:hypothetical protein